MELSPEEVVVSDRVALIVNSVLAGVAVVATVAWEAGLIGDWPTILTVVACSLVGVAILRTVRRKYRPYTFLPLGEKELSARDRRHFTRHAPALQQLGFQNVGDFQLLPPPVEEVARVLVSSDGETFAAVARHEETQYVAFSSMAADGTYFESATLPGGGAGPGPGVPLRFQFLGNASMPEAFTRHQQLVRAHAASHGTEIVDCLPDDFRHVFEYGHRLAGWDLYRQGRKSNSPPPLPDFVASRSTALSEPAAPHA